MNGVTTCHLTDRPRFLFVALRVREVDALVQGGVPAGHAAHPRVLGHHLHQGQGQAEQWQEGGKRRCKCKDSRV